MGATGEEAFYNRTFGPLIFNKDSKFEYRFVSVATGFIYGSTLNLLFVAVFFVADHMDSQKGSIFLGCTGISDLIVSGIDMGISATVLLSEQWNNIRTCHIHHYTFTVSQFSTSVLYMFIALEGYFRIVGTNEEYQQFNHINPAVYVVVIFCFSMSMGILSVYAKFDYDYCTRTTFGKFNFRLLIFILFYALPFVICIICFTKILRCLSKRRHHRNQHRRNTLDWYANLINLYAYATFVVFWIPFMIIVYVYPDIDDAYLYAAAWVGMSRSAISSTWIMLGTYRYREAFRYIILYVFCKRPLPERRPRRGHRAEARMQAAQRASLAAARRAESKYNVRPGIARYAYERREERRRLRNETRV